MFGLLKKKLSEFSKNLKQTILEKKTGTDEEQVPSGSPEEKPAAVPKNASPLATVETKIQTSPTATASDADKTAPSKKEPEPKKTPLTQKSPSPKTQDSKRELHANVGLLQKAKGLLGGEIRLGEKELAPLLDELELALLEADVEQQTADAIIEQLEQQLAGQKITSRTDIDSFIQTEIKKALLARLALPDSVPLLSQITAKKPFVILVLGPNGAGKTTTIAKMVHYFKKHQKSVILAAGDTFRAASIEQLEVHAQRLGVRLIKHAYGADPAAVGFDAVAAAKSHGVDVVLIDSAGRQETNTNLMKELEKIVRVCKPDLKLYILEGYSGQAALGQIREFDRALALDGFVLTKMDTDPKGGGALSVLYHLKK
ncbi:MAG: signal recognition particle-docking protein FtsY, partial [Candidatus Diapherotrites archaeon]|nr:signal recognition particle-docking protein FtsY [Candidatus Diapherotrites archaeon]